MSLWKRMNRAERMVYLTEAGQTKHMSLVARDVEISFRTVAKFSEAHGIKFSTAPDKYTEDHIEAVRTMAAKGAFARDIAAAFGTTKNAVLSLCSRRQIKLSPAPNGPRLTFPPRAERPKPAPKVKATAPRLRPVRPVAPALPPNCSPVEFIDLQPHHCRFAVNDEAPWRFCGEGKAAGHSWCSWHYAIVYQPGSAARRAA